MIKELESKLNIKINKIINELLNEKDSEKYLDKITLSKRIYSSYEEKLLKLNVGEYGFLINQIQGLFNLKYFKK